MASNPETPERPQWGDDADGGVTSSTAPRHMRFVRLSKEDLEYLRSSNSTLELAFFGISAGALLTVVTTLLTVSLPDPSTHAVFVGLTVLFVLASAYFGAASIRGEVRWRKKTKDWIDQVGP